MAISTYKIFLMSSTDGSQYEKLIDIKSFPDLGGAPEMLETTAFGAAGLAGLATGFWSSPEAFLAARSGDTLFEPGPGSSDSAAARAGWHRAVAAVKAFAGDENVR